MNVWQNVNKPHTDIKGSNVTCSYSFSYLSPNISVQIVSGHVCPTYSLNVNFLKNEEKKKMLLLAYKKTFFITVYNAVNWFVRIIYYDCVHKEYYIIIFLYNYILFYLLYSTCIFLIFYILYILFIFFLFTYL